MPSVDSFWLWSGLDVFVNGLDLFVNFHQPFHMSSHRLNRTDRELRNLLESSWSNYMRLK